MKKWLHNEQGLTLTELLATLVIGSIILISIMSAFIFIQKQYGAQANDVKEQTDLSIALKSITREARNAHTFIEENDNQTLRLQTNDEEIIYAYEDTILKRNGMNYLFEIDDFYVEVHAGNKLEIRMENSSGKEISTEIVKRGGHDDQE